jgi:hypothetical protein
MDITPDFLRTEIAAAEQRRDQKLAELNLTLGQLDVLKALLVKAEEPSEAPKLEVVNAVP